MRFEEHYENTHYRGKVFGREEFEDWYAAKYGKFSYYSDWPAFNIPAWVVRKFRKGAFNPLTEKEKRLLKLLRGIERHAAVIGVSPEDGEDVPTRKHEYAHACFTLFGEYRRDAERIVKKHLKRLKKLKKILTHHGYHEKVLVDELHAYVLASVVEFRRELGKERFVSVRRELDQNFEKHFGFSLYSARLEDLLARTHVIKFRWSPAKKVSLE